MQPLLNKIRYTCLYVNDVVLLDFSIFTLYGIMFTSIPSRMDFVCYERIMLAILHTQTFQSTLRVVTILTVCVLWIYTSLTTAFFWTLFLVWAVWRLDSRIIGGGAIVLLVLIPFMLSIEMWAWTAETLAVWVYFLLCITVGLQILELRHTPEETLSNDESVAPRPVSSKGWFSFWGKAQTRASEQYSTLPVHKKIKYLTPSEPGGMRHLPVHAPDTVHEERIVSYNNARWYARKGSRTGISRWPLRRYHGVRPSIHVLDLREQKTFVTLPTTSNAG